MKKIFMTLLVALAFICTGASPRDAMRPAETGQIKDTKFFAVNNSFVSVYLVKTNNGYILFDTGIDPVHLEGQFNELNIDTDEVRWIFLTHTDRDHVASLSLFPNALIYINIEEKQLLDGTTNRNDSGGNTLQLATNKSLNDVNFFKNNQKFTFEGTTVKCVNMPGHTPGSTLFLIDKQYLITGDAFSYIDGKIGVHPFTMDEKLAEKSIKKKNKFINKSKAVMTGHYGIIY